MASISNEHSLREIVAEEAARLGGLSAVAPPKKQKQNILDEAAKVIYGDREKTYGRPDKNLSVIAGMWSAYLSTPVTVDDVCIMMILLKAARLKNDPNHRDSQVDLCGYAALMERVQDYVSSSKLHDNPVSSNSAKAQSLQS